MKTKLNNLILLLIASLILLAVCAAYLICAAGRKEKDGEINLTFIDRIYADVHTLLVAAAALVSFIAVMNGFYLGKYLSWSVFLIIASIDAFIGMSYVLSMARQIKTGTIFKNTLIHIVYDSLKAMSKLGFDGKLFKAWVLLLLFAYGIINGLLFAAGTHINRGYQIPIVFGVFLAFNIAVIYFAAKALLSLSQIMEGVRAISRGNMEHGFNTADMSTAFAGFAEDIQSIQAGLKKAVAEAVKGERMKTDLITNVSHDLKTPLTSIINYIDLLKKESLNNVKANEYVGILEEKSARLKQLVEDLIEASKASSGNLLVNAGRVDLHELVMQACGEYEEKISIAALDMRINAEEKNIIVFADGKHMWRIVENLLLNALKYSMSNSRVYVNLSKNANCGILTIKNISAYPLDISPEQLTERFVRGDASRTTEGSGLGLAIAKSLTELQTGKFSIAIDGDLFKVTVEMPLLEEK